LAKWRRDYYWPDRASRLNNSGAGAGSGI